MDIKEYVNPDGDHVMEIRLSKEKGDRIRFADPNAGPAEAPMAVVYNVGPHLPLQRQDELCRRALVVLRNLRPLVHRVIDDIGLMVDRDRGTGYPPISPTPPCIRVRTRRFAG